jgi:hypothetical protein
MLLYARTKPYLLLPLIATEYDPGTCVKELIANLFGENDTVSKKISNNP